MHHPERWTFDWFYKRNNMDATDNRFYRTTDTEVEERAAELHEGCRMPMEQAREIAASEASPDWYARGQDWGLADALANGQSGEWVLDDIARAFAAGAAVAYSQIGRTWGSQYHARKDCMTMTPTQREAALRLADYFTYNFWPGGLNTSGFDETAALLRELAAEPQSDCGEAGRAASA